MIETPVDAKLAFGDMSLTLQPPLYQSGNHLSLVKIYCLAWMNTRNKDSISFREIISMQQLKNLHDTAQFKELKKLAWENKSLTISDILTKLPHHDRFEYPSKAGYHTNLRDRLLLKAKKVAEKVINIAPVHELVFPKHHRMVMSFELNHLNLLRTEPTFSINYEVYKHQNNVTGWPKTSCKENFKFGWIIFWISSDMTVYISEMQAPCEMLNTTSDGELHYFVEQHNWAGYMLQQFLQHFVLRGFTRFNIPTVEKRLSHVVNNTVESNYRELPRAFGFSKRSDKWWWLDFNL